MKNPYVLFGIGVVVGIILSYLYRRFIPSQTVVVNEPRVPVTTPTPTPTPHTTLRNIQPNIQTMPIMSGSGNVGGAGSAMRTGGGVSNR